MAVTGGRMPYDQAFALTGPARVLYAPITQAVPADLWDVIPAKNTAGAYAPLTGWIDLGLAAEAPSYTHSKETDGLEYQQPTQELFQEISKIERTFTTNVAEISAASLKIIENTQAANEAVASSANKSAQTKVGFGLYPDFITYRICLVSYRPSGSAVVTEPDGTIRPPAVGLILPQCRLSSEDSEMSFERGTPTSCNVTFTVFPESTLPAGKEHGYWSFESAGTIAAV